MSRLTLADIPHKYQDQIAAQIYPKPATQTKRLRQQEGDGMNKTEREFKDYLEKEIAAPSGPATVHTQDITLKIGNGVRYTPDFSVTILGKTAFYEVKGFMRDDAAVKLKVAARTYHEYNFYLVTKLSKKQGGGWNFQYILP